MHIIGCVNVFIELTILWYYCYSLYDKKPTLGTVKKSGVYFVLTAASLLTVFLSLPTHINLVISFFVCLGFMLFLCDGKLGNKVFFTFVYMVTIFASDIFATEIIVFFGIEYSYSGSDLITFIVGASLSDFIRFLILTYVCRILRRKVRELPASYWTILLISPAVSLAALVVFDIYLMNNIEINWIITAVPPIALIYLNFMLFRLFETYSSKLKLGVIEKLNQKEEENYKLLERNENDLRKLKHDMKNHVMIVQEYLRLGKIDDAREYLNEIQEELKNISSVIYTGNFAVDAAVNIGSRKAKASDIEYNVQVLSNAELNVTAADACTVLCNAIDNAIEACGACQDKYVYIELRINDDEFLIHIENPTVIPDGERAFETTKADKKRHGFGMKNIDYICRKYNGYSRYKAKDGVFSFDAFIPNKCKEQ